MCFKTEIACQFIKSLGLSPEIIQTDKLVYEPLKGGGSAATLYRFDLNEFSYVMRLFPAHALSLTRIHQIMLAKQAGEMDFGPKIHFVDSQMNGMIMEFIPGHTVEESDFKDVSYLSKFAKFLQRLHHCKANFPLAVSPFKRLHGFYLQMEKTNSIFPLRFSEIKNLMKDIETIFELLPVDLVPSHLDLHPLNIMFGKNRFFLVDWVNGGMSDPYFDLVSNCKNS